MIQYQKTTLDNGIRVVTEHHPGSRALSLGFWIEKGTRDEKREQVGISHFIEHLVFKRTKRRSAYQIAKAMEAVGGDLNAYTSREHTCFMTMSLKDHLLLSVDVLSDLVCRAQFDRSDFGKEKQVVLQEIHMSEDLLEDFIYDLYFKLAYLNGPMGWPILGTPASLESLSLKTVFDYYKQTYTSENLIISAAGHVDHARLLDVIERKVKFARVAKTPGQKPKTKRAAVRRRSGLHGFRVAIEKPAEQVHILIGLPASSFKDSLRFEAFVVNSLLGGGMTSRLYQKIREEKGLAYSVYSQLSTFIDSGIEMIYAATEPKHVRQTVDLIARELKRLKRDGLRKSDLDLFKTQVTGQILLGADDVENRMNSLGVNEMILGSHRSVDDVMREIQAVTQDTVQEYLEKYLDFDRLGVLLLGAYKKSEAGWLDDLGL